MLPKNVPENAASPETCPSLEVPPVGLAPSVDVITETEAYQRFGHLLEDKELRIARQEGRLGYVRRKRTIFYRLSELQAFINAALEREYVRAPRAKQPRLKPASIEHLRIAPPAPATSSRGDAALSRLAQKVARSEGRI